MPSVRIRPRDLLVEYRDKNLQRQGSIPIEDLVLKMQPVYNGVGSWSVQLPAEHRAVPYLRTPGSGIVVTNLLTGETLLSGSTSRPTKRATNSDPKGTVAIAGLDDNRLLWDARAFPDPAQADPNLQTKSHDVRTGGAEAIIRQYVAYNICNGAIAATGPVTWAPAGRLGGLRNKLRLQAVSGGLGAVTTRRVRFDNLGDLVAGIAIEAGLGFRIVQVEDELELQVYEPTDRSAEIRLDVQNGTLTETSVETAPAEVTRVIVAGQGEGVERNIKQYTSTESTQSEDDWGLIIEEWVDQRQTNVDDELQSAATERLNEAGFTKVAVKATPANDQTMIFLTDFFLGDKTAVVIDGQEQPNSIITEAAIVVDASGLKTAVAIGDIFDFDSSSALRQTVADTQRRVDNLERNAEASSGVGIMADTGDVKMTARATAPDGWLLCQGQSLLRVDYPALFDAIGTTYGAADSTHFNIPDLRGRVAVGRDSAQSEFNVLGEKGGAKTHTLTAAEIPAHSHIIRADITAYGGGVSSSFHLGTNSPSHPTGFGTQDMIGGGGAHNNLQPYIALNYIIKI